MKILKKDNLEIILDDSDYDLLKDKIIYLDSGKHIRIRQRQFRKLGIPQHVTLSKFILPNSKGKRVFHLNGNKFDFRKENLIVYYNIAERERVQQRKYAYTVKRRYLLVKQKHEKKKYKDLLLTFEEYCFTIKLPCYYCNIVNNKTSGVGLDRIDNELGYSKENTLPCCGLCNKIRSDILTVEETKIAVKAILKYRATK